MRILALYLKEEIERKVNGKKQTIWRIPATDVQICQALKSLGHKVEKKAYDPEKSLKLDKKYDVIFNMCDGLEYDNDFIEFKVLKDIEKTGISFTGNNLKTIMFCNDKRNIKKRLVKNNILTPKFQIFTKPNQKLKPELKFPLIVKPVCADGAVGIYADSVVRSVKQLRKKIKRVLTQHDQPAALVEEFIDGRDMVIPVIGKNKVTVIPIEVQYIKSYKNKTKILSYAAKWDKKKSINKDYRGIIKNMKKRYPKKELDKIKSVAAKVYRVMGCTGYATVDARYKDGKLYIIEINPNCWIGKDSDTAVGLKKIHGIDYPGFINRIVKIAKEK